MIATACSSLFSTEHQIMKLTKLDKRNVRCLWPRAGSERIWGSLLTLSPTWVCVLVLCPPLPAFPGTGRPPCLPPSSTADPIDLHMSRTCTSIVQTPSRGLVASVGSYCNLRRNGWTSQSWGEHVPLSWPTCPIYNINLTVATLTCYVRTPARQHLPYPPLRYINGLFLKYSKH